MTLAMQLAAAPALKVPWAQTPMYNTLMSVAAGAGLILVNAVCTEHAESHHLPGPGAT